MLGAWEHWRERAALLEHRCAWLADHPEHPDHAARTQATLDLSLAVGAGGDHLADWYGVSPLRLLRLFDQWSASLSTTHLQQDPEVPALEEAA